MSKEKKFYYPKTDAQFQKEEILKTIHECIEKQKEEEMDLHNIGMLDGMLVIQAAVNGNPWPL